LDEFTARKLAHNEALFREVNERIHDIRGHVAPDESSYICECVNARCFETIALSNTTYREIRVEPTHFVVVPGHELEDIERVVRRTDAYLIVEKVVPVPPVADPS
jgi:hypothetical protein